MKKTTLLILVFVTLSHIIYGQVYIEKQTRHRFAQLNLGLDVESNFGGHTKYLNQQGSLVETNINSTLRPRFVIGGTHFWGHADFYIAIPVIEPKIKKDNQEILSFRGVETVFKYYPYRIENKKLRPFIGLSLAPFYFEQNNGNLEYPEGPELNFTRFPLMSGITYNSSNYLFDLGLTWNYSHKQAYYISRDQAEIINTPPFYVNVSFRYILETTLSAEKDWESGRTQELTDKLADLKKLNGFYFGVGISSAFWLKESSYNVEQRPYLNKYSTSIMADFTLGYYLHKPDVNIALAYRAYGSSTNAFGAIQVAKRKSILLEATKYLFDYHGFAPFLGPNISYEKLAFKESFEGNLNYDLNENLLTYGLTFGWDIRPNRIQSWLLRTNLRWYPNLDLELEPNQSISFDNIEFNFIQLIIYPNRMIKTKSSPNK